MRNYKFWTSAELTILKQGIQPTGRTARACTAIATRLKIEGIGKKIFKRNENLLKEIDKKFSKKGNNQKSY